MFFYGTDVIIADYHKQDRNHFNPKVAAARKAKKIRLVFIFVFKKIIVLPRLV
jgi:hypothetical protein